MCAVPFAQQEFFVNPDVDVVPRQNLVLAELTVRVKGGVDAHGGEYRKPFFVIEMLVPAVKPHPHAVRFGKRRIQLPVAPCEHRLDAADAGVMIVVFDFPVRDFARKIPLLFRERLHIALRLPLERRERLRNKAGGGDGHTGRIFSDGQAYGSIRQ